MIALLVSILGRCPEVVSFLENDPRDLSDADMAIASLKLLPLNWDRCPSMRPELTLYTKHVKRMRDVARSYLVMPRFFLL